MANIIFTTEPQAALVVPGLNTTFTAEAQCDVPSTIAYQWLVDGTPVPGATEPSFMIDPVMEDNGKQIGVEATASDDTGVIATASFCCVTLNVIEDSAPFDVYDVPPETGRERHRRLRLLGYI